MPARPPLLLLAALLAATACHRDAIAPLTPGGPSRAPVAPALVEVTISGIGSPRARASISSASVLAPGPATRSGVSYSLTAPPDSGDGSIELTPVATGSFTRGERSSGGERYVWATFRVRNAQSDGTAYDTPRQNLTFFAASTPGTVGGSAIASLARFDGSAADPAIATQIRPTGAVTQALDGSLVSRGADVLQVLSESEAAAIAAPGGVDVLPYGFVVRNASDDGRRLAASPAPDQYDGIVTFAFRIPLQSSAAADPFTVSAIFLAQDDSETRVTQSLEEQTEAGEAAFLARALAIGATTRTVLPGTGSYGGDPNSSRNLCSVRTAGPSSSPAGYLVSASEAVGAGGKVAILDSRADYPLWTSGGARRRLNMVVLDAKGAPVMGLPMPTLSFGTPGILTAGSNGWVRRLLLRDRVSTTVTATACGFTSPPITLRTSGFSPITAGSYHSAALKSDGTVVAWGDNRFSQTNVPSGLMDVVQIAAGEIHSLALKHDGTVVAWGDNASGQLNVPANLSDVAQIATGGLHSMALKSDGTVVAWGDNQYGQTQLPAGLTNVVQITGGGRHSIALKSDGTVVAWGDNSLGQTSVPSKLTDVVQVAAGLMYSLALKDDGTVVAWGDNSFGQRNVPSKLSDVVQIAAGSKYSLALKSDGTVVAWGDNSFGQTNVPAGLTDVVQIAAGTSHVLALKRDGTVVGWGEDAYGQATVPAGLVAAVP